VFSRFLGAYEHLSPLSALEVEALPLFLRAGHLADLVNDCRRLIKTPPGDTEADVREYDARALVLALQLGFAGAQAPPGAPA
jgi:Ser/Thr protein kinase RdoA (MazF antagonist)